MVRKGKSHMASKDDMGSLVNELLDSLIIPVASRWGMVGGVMTSATGWLISAQGVATVGLIITISGFVISYLFQRRREHREKALNELLIMEAKERIKVLRNEQHSN